MQETTSIPTNSTHIQIFFWFELLTDENLFSHWVICDRAKESLERSTCALNYSWLTYALIKVNFDHPT